MARVYTTVKETYEQVSEYEYNQINPYIQAIGAMRHKYGEIDVKWVKTIVEIIETGSSKHDELKKTSYGVLEVPTLQVGFEVVE